MTPFRLHARSGFTLVEIIIVLGIISILLSISLFPYQYYMNRGYVERATDSIAQEWIIAHKEVSNGLQFSPTKNASIVLLFQKGSSNISLYLLSGSTLPVLPTTADTPLAETPDLLSYKSVTMERGISILGFTGAAGVQDLSTIGYVISPPYATGAFFTGSTVSTLSGISLLVGYNGATLDTGLARTILLRPYLQ